VTGGPRSASRLLCHGHVPQLRKPLVKVGCASLVPKIPATEHCSERSTAPELFGTRRIYQDVDGKLDPFPSPVRVLFQELSKERPRDPARGVFSFLCNQHQVVRLSVWEPNRGWTSMSLTIAECAMQARYCEWYAARTQDEGDRKYLLRKARDWKRLAAKKEMNIRWAAKAAA